MSKSGVKTLTCAERNAYLIPAGTPPYEGWAVESSLTDLIGEFGEPRIDTTWVKGEVRVRDVRHPAPFCEDIVLENITFSDDVKPCEHYYWKGSDDD